MKFLQGIDMENISQVIELLSAIEGDNTVPKNVRSKVNQAIAFIKDDGNASFDVLIDRTIQSLDELSNDPNIPTFTRTQIWSVISALESK